MSVDVLGENCDHAMPVQCCFTSTETVRLIRTESPGRPPRLWHSSWTLGTPLRVSALKVDSERKSHAAPSNRTHVSPTTENRYRKLDRQREWMNERTKERPRKEQMEKITKWRWGHCHLHSVICLLKKTLNKLYWSSILRVVNKWDQHDTFLLGQLRNHPPYTCIRYIIPSSFATRQWSRP